MLGNAIVVVVFIGGVDFSGSFIVSVLSFNAWVIWIFWDWYQFAAGRRHYCVVCSNRVKFRHFYLII